MPISPITAKTDLVPFSSSGEVSITGAMVLINS